MVTSSPRSTGGSLAADAADQQRRRDEARRVGRDRRRGADPLHEQTAEAGAERSVALERLTSSLALPSVSSWRSTIDGQDRLVRDVEEHRERSGDEHDREQLRVAQDAERRGDRHRRECDGAADVAPDEDRSTRGSRSTIAPAGSPNRTNGENSTAVSAPTSNVVACRTEIATSGSASRLTWLPSCDTDSADQSRMKSRCRKRERPRSASAFTTARTYSEGRTARPRFGRRRSSVYQAWAARSRAASGSSVAMSSSISPGSRIS